MTFLLEAMIFLGAAIVAVPISKRLGMSVVLGYLAAGVIIGPSGIGLIGLQEEATEVMHFAEIGVVFLLFIIGLELQPKRLWVMRRLVFGLGTGQVGIDNGRYQGVETTIIDGDVDDGIASWSFDRFTYGRLFAITGPGAKDDSIDDVDDAIIGVDLDYETVGKSMLMVSANGTAVKLR